MNFLCPLVCLIVRSGTANYFYNKELGNSQKKNHAQQKSTKKHRPKGAIGKNRASAFYFSGPGLNRKRILAQAIAHQKSHAQPRGAKKFSCPKNCPTRTPPPVKKIIVPLLLKQCHKEVAAKCTPLHVFNDLFVWNGFFDISKRYVP